MPFEEQTASILAVTNGYLDTVATTDVSRYEQAMLAYLRSDHADVLNTIRDTKDLGDDAKKGLVAALDTLGKIFASIAMLTAHALLAWTVMAIGLVVLPGPRSEEHTSDLQSLMRISSAVLLLTQ